MMEELKTIFYLIPLNHCAIEIIQDPANRNRRCLDPVNPAKSCLRIGLDQNPKSPPHLARFGRHERNDVVLNQRFSRNDQCYFDFNKETGELLLHDLSANDSTELFDVIYSFVKETKRWERKAACAQMWKTPRQCVVVLSPDAYHDNERHREWIFKISFAEFLLIPRRTQGQGEAEFTKDRLAFAGQPNPEPAYAVTLQQLISLALPSSEPETLTATHRALSNVKTHNTRFRGSLEPEEDKLMRYTKLRLLGEGGQGAVHKVVDMYNGNHRACKIIAVKEKVADLNIFSAKDFRKMVENEVNLVQKLLHVSSLIRLSGFVTLTII